MKLDLIDGMGEGMLYGALIGPGAGAYVGYVKTHKFGAAIGALISKPAVDLLNGILHSVGGTTGFGGSMGW